ncbi:MAG TPA: response regulator [Bacteroides sp.]|nr:response regulator [Bacteroides sp.]
MHDWSDKIILVAEDVAANYLLIEAVLEMTKAKVIWAQNGKEAVEACIENDGIDLVLMDIRMPEMNGIDATKAIKKFRSELPIIAQTAFSYNHLDEEIIAAGCQKVITKPISPQILINSISDYI